MTKQARYTATVKQIFSAYIDGIIDNEELIQKLREIEMQLMSDQDSEDEETEATKGLWIRFFEGDTEGLTIQEIENDLSNQEHPNYKILRHGIAIGLADDELEVHYD
ncbi:hypothetical protein H8S95_04120 [Pontibacter sp. KCTC 32443]|uniref:hypothetical protein n=1 Tax=Pontibacter TaxID=323449 RepID=UPI00164D7CE2|nr:MULTISPECIES: hypothetical protein [Pontibacter]MBC5773240.1 hypothetical protein [Pontibacter sp. KCTC 32443]